MGKPKVLVVDDDSQIRRTVARLIGQWCDVTLVSDGTEAIDTLRQGLHPDLVLSDVDMPSMDGVSMYRKAVSDSLLPREAFVFMSGGQTGDRIPFLVKEGVFVVRKPFDNEYLLRVLENRLSEVALTRFRRVANMVI